MAEFAVAFLALGVEAIPLETGPDVVVHTSLAFHQPAASTLNRWLGRLRGRMQRRARGGHGSAEPQLERASG